MKQVITYLQDVRFELTKVIWPKKEEVTKLTLLVILVSIIVGLYVGVLDYSFTKLLEYLIELN